MFGQHCGVDRTMQHAWRTIYKIVRAKKKQRQRPRNELLCGLNINLDKLCCTYVYRAYSAGRRAVVG